VPELRDEVLGLTQALIRIDTSNPPGGETAAARFLADYLGGAGIECELVGPDPDRLNLVARVGGRGEGPSLMLLAHTDVVPAPTADWTVPPFEGRLREGRVLGRGAGDMKGELAARAVAIADLARSGEPPAGDVVLIAESDEERNTAGVGMSWLIEERPDLRCDYALNEGGGLLLELADGSRVVTIAVGEKQVTSLRIRIFGAAGHASIPDRADNPLVHAAAAIDRLRDHRPPGPAGGRTEEALAALGVPLDEEADPISWAAGQHPVLADLLPAMSRMTVTPTGLGSHEPANVIPPFADLICDCRALPGQTEDDIREYVERALGDEIPHELELLEPLEGGTESTIDSPLYRVCEEYVAARLPGAELLPIVSPGFNDSHWIRGAHEETVAYGFAPVFATPPDAYLAGIHGADEALALADLVEMARFHLHALRAIAGSGQAGAPPE
jgi:acetylornithine deacetylase/succinyl-diaminopimelate desuccinylase-like protein